MPNLTTAIFRLRPWLFLLLGLSLFLMNPIIFADTAPVITLNQAVEMALKNNYQVVTARNDLEKSQLAVKQEIIKIFPQASIDGKYGYDLKKATNPTNYTVTISETIPTKYNLYGKKVVSNIDVSLWDQLYNDAQYQITVANTIYNTTEKYLNALKALKILKLQETAVKNAQISNKLASEQLRQGKITKTTQLKTESDLASANFNLEKSQADYEMALQQFANQIGFNQETQILLIEDPKNLDLMKDINFGELKTKALKERLEIQQSQITIKKAQRTLAQATNKGLPDLNLSYHNVPNEQSYSLSYSFLSGDLSWNASTNSGQIPGMINDNRYNSGESIVLRLTWNLDFWLTRNQVAQEKLTLENAEITQKQTIQGIKIDLEQAISDYKIALKKTASDHKAIEYYQKDFEIKKLQYQLGSITQLDVSTAEQNLLQAQIELIKSNYDQYLAFQKLKLHAGDLYQFEQENDSQGGIGK